MVPEHSFDSFFRVLCYLGAGIMVLLSLPALLESLENGRSAVLAVWCSILLLMLWSQRKRIPAKVFPWIMGLSVFSAVVLIYNAGQIIRARNIWQFLTFADHTPWTAGHTIGTILGIVAGLAAVKAKTGIGPAMNREEILSGPRLVSMEAAQRKVRRHNVR